MWGLNISNETTGRGTKAQAKMATTQPRHQHIVKAMLKHSESNEILKYKNTLYNKLRIAQG